MHPEIMQWRIVIPYDNCWEAEGAPPLDALYMALKGSRKNPGPCRRHLRKRGRNWDVERLNETREEDSTYRVKFWSNAHLAGDGGRCYKDAVRSAILHVSGGAIDVPCRYDNPYVPRQ